MTLADRKVSGRGLESKEHRSRFFKKKIINSNYGDYNLVLLLPRNDVKGFPFII